MVFLLAEDEEIEQKEYEEYLGRALWFAELEETDIKNGKQVIRGKAKAVVHMEIPVLNVFISKKKEFTVSGCYYRMQPEQVKRYKP
jgi:hypothetical protein